MYIEHPAKHRSPLLMHHLSKLFMNSYGLRGVVLHNREGVDDDSQEEIEQHHENKQLKCPEKERTCMQHAALPKQVNFHSQVSPIKAKRQMLGMACAHCSYKRVLKARLRMVTLVVRSTVYSDKFGYLSESTSSQLVVVTFVVRNVVFNPVGSAHSVSTGLEREPDSPACCSTPVQPVCFGKLVGDRFAKSCAINGLLASICPSIVENSCLEGVAMICVAF
jgi:DNA-directed RNA polymerase subunit RPC12/RpoP